MTDVEAKTDQMETADVQNESSTFSLVEAKLAEMNEKDADLATGSVVTPEPVSDPDPKADDPDPVPDPEEGDSPLLPAGHRRAALGRGWTTEQIDYHLKTKPDEAVAHFEGIYDKWQEENTAYSAAGRKLRSIAQQDTQDPETPVEPLVHVDAKALVDEHGEEAVVSALVERVNAMMDQVNTATAKISKSEEFLRDTETSALEKVVQEFFMGDEMQSSQDTYGTDVLTQEHVDARKELLLRADDMIIGATEHGRELSVQEALERAHVTLSQGTQDERIRADIRESMKKRTITTQGSHQETVLPEGNREFTMEEFEKRVAEKMRAQGAGV